jgi:3-oxoacyl-[acyl-carrier protein] reductase
VVSLEEDRVHAMDLTGRRVLVTGGTRGVGLAAARALVAAGAEVVVTGTKVMPSLYDVDLSRFDYHQLQLTRRDSIDYLLGHLGPIDVLVNAAGASIPHSHDLHHREFVAHSARVGLVGPTHLTTRLRWRLCESLAPGGGAVVNTGAVRAWGELTQSPIDAQNDLVAMTRRLGETWARHGARVNTVIESAPVRVPQQVRVQISRDSGPLLTRTTQRTGTVDDIAAAVLFLAGPGSAWITGQTLHVNAVARGHDL